MGPNALDNQRERPSWLQMGNLAWPGETLALHGSVFALRRSRAGHPNRSSEPMRNADRRPGTTPGLCQIQRFCALAWTARSLFGQELHANFRRANLSACAVTLLVCQEGHQGIVILLGVARRVAASGQPRRQEADRSALCFTNASPGEPLSRPRRAAFALVPAAGGLEACLRPRCRFVESDGPSREWREASCGREGHS